MLSSITFGSAAEFADELRAAVAGEVVLPADPAYDAARRVWSAAVDRRPAAVVRCAGTADVEAVVRAARRHGLPLAVRGGGHDWTGRALVDGGLVVDLTRLRGVAVDPVARVATVGGGVLARELIAAAAPHGLVPPVGNCGTVGVAGFTLGGGYGPAAGVQGLGADNLLGAEVVLADGRRVWADAAHEPELFWALRGGGGNFGVVTAMRIRLHPAGELLGGVVVYDGADAGAVLRRYGAFAAAAPDALGGPTVLMTGPDGRPAVAFTPYWSGDRAGGERVLRELQAFGTPQHSAVGPTTYAEVLAPVDAHVDMGMANGHRYVVRTRSFPAVTPPVADVLAAALARKTSPLSNIALHHLHGAASRVAPEATAFGVRREHFMVHFTAAWTPGDGDGAAHRRWAEEFSAALAPYALPGGYANLLGPDEPALAAAAYGGNAARLRAAKRRYDPDGVFASAIPLPDA